MSRIQPDPKRADELAVELFDTEDRGHTGTQALHFINNGGRSKLDLFLGFDVKGRYTVPLAPTMHRRIHADLIAVAHDYARARFGRRADWPARFTVERPVVPAAPGRPQPMPCPNTECKKTGTLALNAGGVYVCRACEYKLLDPAAAYPDVDLSEGKTFAALEHRGNVLHLVVPRQRNTPPAPNSGHRSIRDVIEEAGVLVLPEEDHCCTGVKLKPLPNTGHVLVSRQIGGLTHDHQSPAERQEAAEMDATIRQALPATDWHVVTPLPDGLVVAPVRHTTY